VLGGVLVQSSWRLVFLVNVPVGIAALVAAVVLVPDSRDDGDRALPDLVGAGVLAVAIGSLSLGLVKGPDWGWTSQGALSAFAVTVVGLGLFGVRNRRQPSPVIDPDLLRVRTFAWSNATSLAFSVAFAANLLLAILWMQDVWHFSPIETGLAVAPGPLMVPGFAILGGLIARRFGAGAVTAAGCVLFAVGVGLTQLLLGPIPHYLAEMLPGQIVGGIGVGLALPTILSSATSDLPLPKAATGSAVVNMSRQIGSVIGVSVLIALLGTPATYAQAARAFEHARLACIAAALVGAATATGMPGRLRSPGGRGDLQRADTLAPQRA
jgi:hypothetical protein